MAYWNSAMPDSASEAVQTAWSLLALVVEAPSSDTVGVVGGVESVGALMVVKEVSVDQSDQAP
jgi:hypothetical protein